jgi:protein translocase, SecG subunit
MLQTILLVAMILISVALTAVVLLQRSEGGALGMGGGPSGMMTARGAGNFLTTTTWWLAVLFFACAIALTIAGNFSRSSSSVVDTDAVRGLAIDPTQQSAPVTPTEAAPVAPVTPSTPTLDDLESSLGTAPSSTAPAN